MNRRVELAEEVLRLLLARRSDGTISLVSRFEGEYPKRGSVPEPIPPTKDRLGGPTRRLCPLTEPNEEMALKALMEVWFSFSTKNRHRFTTGGARQPAIPGIKTP